MAGIINALFGHHKDKDEKKHDESVETTTTVAASTSTGSAMSHTAISDDVRVKSVVSSETRTNTSMQNARKMSELMNKLGTTHTQIDEYSKKRNAEISDAVTGSIQKVVSDTATQQQMLLTDANARSAAIESEYKHRLQERVAQLDAEKAVLLAELERSLNARQEAILLKAKQDIDAVQSQANQEKLAVLKEAQARASVQIDQITDKVAEMAAEDAQRRLQSTTTTTITTKAESSGETHVAGSTVGSTVTTNKKMTTESYDARRSSSTK